jgi:WD40 repeat protein
MATAATMREEGDEEKQCMWGFANNSIVQVPAENDDFASCILAGAGIPLDDPAWYDTKSDAYNYDTGIGVCLHMIRLHSAVISLSFHPSGEVLAMASGSTLHIWDYNEENRRRERKPKAGAISLHPSMLTSERESESRMLNRSEHNDFPRTQTIDFRHASALRCVHFPPCGKAIIVGGVNPQSANEGLNDPRRATSFYLRLWDFSLDAVLNPTTSSGVEVKSSTKGEVLPRGGRISDDGELTWDYRVLKEVLCNVSSACDTYSSSWNKRAIPADDCIS